MIAQLDYAILHCMPQRVPLRALSVPRVPCLFRPMRLMLSMCDDVLDDEWT